MEEAFKYTMMVTSLLDTLISMVIRALATTSAYGVMVSSDWVRNTFKMEDKGEEALSTLQMERRRNMTFD